MAADAGWPPRRVLRWASGVFVCTFVFFYLYGCTRPKPNSCRPPQRRALASDDATTKCRVAFSQVREDKEMCAFGCCKCVQLSEVSFFAGEQRLNATSVSNPGGRSPPSQGPGSAIDGLIDTKWIDMSLPNGFPPGPEGYSVLEVELADSEGGASITSYSLTTANDAIWRDPAAWTVHCWLPDGAELSDTRDEASASMPEARHAKVGPFELLPIASPPPVTIPSPPPSAPPTPAHAGDLRLVGGASAAQGILQVYHGGKWGTVCDDGFTMVDAHVACRQLGFDAGAAELMHYRPAWISENTAHFSASAAERAVWMDSVQCDGTEARLADCPFGGWGRENCQHAEDVAVRCNATLAPSLSAAGAGHDHAASHADALPPCVEGDAADATAADGESCAECLRGVLAILSLPSIALLMAAAAVSRRLRQVESAEFGPETAHEEQLAALPSGDDGLHLCQSWGDDGASTAPPAPERTRRTSNGDDCGLVYEKV